MIIPLFDQGQGNLFTYCLDENGVLEQAGSYHLGEQVTQFDTGRSHLHL